MLNDNINLENKTILLTGAAGFIGANLAMRLIKDVPSATIIGVDNMNDYYDPALKEFRLSEIDKLHGKFTYIKGDIADKALIDRLFAEYKFDIVVNLAAQAGVRYSITNPDAYIQSNLIGFYNILEACRHSYDNGRKGVEHLVYASSSSVYGNNKKVPYSTDDKVDNPISFSRTHIPNYIISRPRDFVSLLSMVRQDVRIWRISASRTNCAKARRSRSSTTVTANVTSRLSMILSKVYRVSCGMRPSENRAKTDCL